VTCERKSARTCAVEFMSRLVWGVKADPSMSVDYYTAA
jgi:hypothetical protein